MSNSLANLEFEIGKCIRQNGKEETIVQIHGALLACLYDGLAWNDPNFFDTINAILAKQSLTDTKYAN